MKFLALILALSISSVAYADNVIVGAFGQKLRAVNNFAVVDGKLQFVKNTSTGALKYRFKPEKPYPAFTDYLIYATPVSKVTYQIRMSVRVTHCDEKKNILREVLSNKYSSLKHWSDRGNWDYNVEQLDERRKIWLACKTGRLLELNYLDVELRGQVVEEKASLVDKSNF